MFHENAGKHADAVPGSHAFFAVDLDPFHAAAGRIALEDKSQELLLFQLGDLLSSPGGHLIGLVDPCLDRYQSVETPNCLQGA